MNITEIRMLRWMTSNAFKIEQNIKICAVTARGSTHRGKMRETRNGLFMYKGDLLMQQ